MSEQTRQESGCQCLNYCYNSVFNIFHTINSNFHVRLFIALKKLVYFLQVLVNLINLASNENLQLVQCLYLSPFHLRPSFLLEASSSWRRTSCIFHSSSVS